MSEQDRKRLEVINTQSSKRGLRGKVNAKCCECIYDPMAAGSGSWRKQVEACTSYDCPLYTVRPVSEKGDKPLDKGKIIDS